MQIIDLSQVIRTGMPVFPGDAPPRFERVAHLAKDGCNMLQVTMNYHVGTHIDAPRHMNNSGFSVEQLPLSQFGGRGAVVDCRAVTDGCVTAAFLATHAQLIRQADYLLLYTGWSQFWGTLHYFEPFPVLDEEAVHWLRQFHLKGVGIDALSIDRLDAADNPIHHLLLGAGMVIVENLTGLEALLEKKFTFYCLPLAIENADGSPVRAAAVL